MQPRLVHHSTPQPHLPLDAFENWMEFFFFFFFNNQGMLVHYNRNVFWEECNFALKSTSFRTEQSVLLGALTSDMRD